MSSKKQEKVIVDQVELTKAELGLVRWEEFALAMEEHYHALELFQRRPDGLPMGHR